MNESVRLPSVLSVGFSRIGYEVRNYFKTPDSMIFNFAFPLLMLSIFTLAFGNLEIEIPGVRTVYSADFYLPAMLALGVFISGAQNLGVDIAIERNDGTLKRLAGSPISPVSYFIGKFGQVIITGSIQAVLILALAGIVFGAVLPDSLDNWLIFGWVFILGLIASAVIGIGISALPRSAKSATSVVLPPVLILQFMSGVYLDFNDLPEWLQGFASFFPLKWIAQGMRAAFLPDEFKANEVGGEWFLDQTATVLGIWLIVGVVIALATFRWIKR